MNRRAFVTDMVAIGVGLIALVSGSGVLAQRARPGRPGHPGGAVRPGRFYEGGMNYAPAAGVFKVNAVDTRENIVKLSDADGRTADVYVNPRSFDLTTLKPGDEVAVDFFVPDDNDDRLEAASIYKLE